ncbi:amidohydrolase family protein [Virgibacillus necropolis]|uniref:amidohydrolase family protein n=1 Tax=Virgibacillus necropolis TaxID=163877 RepID=UPI00384F29BB
MNNAYVIRGKKLVTVSEKGTIYDGAMFIKDGKIIEVGSWTDFRHKYAETEVIDYSSYVITPSLVDCHTHLLEFAPTSLHPITNETHFLSGKAILLHALSSGITALGEQICGHPMCDFSIDEYREVVKDIPLDISFAATSISIGFKELTHFTSITKSSPVKQKDLSNFLLVKEMAQCSDYPGENIFINATPANFTADIVPRAGEIMYTLEELNKIVEIYHQFGKQIGAHVAGYDAIQMTLDAGLDVLHHAHGITDEQIVRAKQQGVKIVATPMGGTHLEPNSPENILKLTQKNIPVSIATDAYLPPYPDASWLPFQDQDLKGPDMLMLIAHPSMKLLKENGYDENDILSLLTANPADILGNGNEFGRLVNGMDANFLVVDGIPGLDVTDIEEIRKVYFRGKKVIDRAF